jgi:hypothetical protein
MSAYTANLESYLDTDARFRALCAFISDNLTAGGIVKTADTGQINLVTVNKPTASNTSAGYEIRRFDDALQATKPVFFKLEFGTAIMSANHTHLGLWLTIGTGSDGAGNITGTLFARTQIHSGSTLGTNSADSTNLRTHYLSAATNRFSFFLHNSATNTMRYALGLERSKDAANADTNAGLILIFGCMYFTALAQNNGAFLKSQYLPFSGTVPSAEESAISAPNVQTTAIVGADTTIFPIEVWDIGRQRYPGRNFAACYHTDFINQSTYTINVGGVNQTMIRLVNEMAASDRALVATNFALVMRYE